MCARACKCEELIALCELLGMVILEKRGKKDRNDVIS